MRNKSRPPITRDSLWHTKEGLSIRVREMETTHIEHALKVLEKYAGWRPGWKEVLQQELVLRGSGQEEGPAGKLADKSEQFWEEERG